MSIIDKYYKLYDLSNKIIKKIKEELINFPKKFWYIFLNNINYFINLLVINLIFIITCLFMKISYIFILFNLMLILYIMMMTLYVIYFNEFLIFSHIIIGFLFLSNVYLFIQTDSHDNFLILIFISLIISLLYIMLEILIFNNSLIIKNINSIFVNIFLFNIFYDFGIIFLILIIKLPKLSNLVVILISLFFMLAIENFIQLIK